MAVFAILAELALLGVLAVLTVWVLLNLLCVLAVLAVKASIIIHQEFHYFTIPGPRPRQDRPDTPNLKLKPQALDYYRQYFIQHSYRVVPMGWPDTRNHTWKKQTP